MRIVRKRGKKDQLEHCILGGENKRKLEDKKQGWEDVGWIQVAPCRVEDGRTVVNTVMELLD